MLSVTFWVFLVIVQGQGVSAIANSTADECRQELADTLKLPDTLATTDCVKLTMSKTPGHEPYEPDKPADKGD